MGFFTADDFEQIYLEFYNSTVSGGLFDLYALKINDKLMKAGIMLTEKCEHPKEKVKLIEVGTSGDTNLYREFECQCGVVVKPSKFEEIK